MMSVSWCDLVRWDNLDGYDIVFMHNYRFIDEVSNRYAKVIDIHRLIDDFVNRIEFSI